MQMRWSGVTPEQYDQMEEKVRWNQESPAGGIFHIAWFEDGALRVVDAWESAEAFQTFVNDRLMPGVQALGIEGQPDVDIQPAHRVWDPVSGKVW